MTPQPQDLRAELASVLAEMRERADSHITILPTWLRDYADRIEAAITSHGGGGEAVAWRIQWSEAIPGDWELTYSAKRVAGCRALENPPHIEPLYTTPQPRGEGMVDDAMLARASVAYFDALPVTGGVSADPDALRAALKAALAAAPGEGSGA